MNNLGVGWWLITGESVDEAIEKIKRDLWPTWKSGAMYWPLLDFVTFRYIPIHLQVAPICL